METTKKTVSYLPHELIIQILLRLPVKSLICFKCVCKSWLTLISDTDFANSQFEIKAATQTALFISTVSPHQIRSVDLEEASLDNDSALASLNPNFLPTERFSHNLEIKIKGSCRGFILLHCSSSLYLWNPSTGVHKNIPLGSNLDAHKVLFYGFGYDQLTDDYLIVSMLSGTSQQLWEFFSLRENKWKQIEGPDLYYMNTVDNETAIGWLSNGAIHWLAYRPDLEKQVILAFDLMERNFLEINLPDEFEFVEQLLYCGFWVYREFLSLWTIDFDNDNDTMDLWVMKEYKVHSSWTKTHAIPSKYFSPLCCTKSGDIVGTNSRSRIVKYNDEGQLLWYRSYFKYPYGSHVAMYTESLLSLPGENVQVKEDGTNKKNEDDG